MTTQPTGAALIAAERLNVLIAERCGIEPGKYRCPECKTIPIEEVTSGGYHTVCWNKAARHIPEYTSDLNACAQMEATLGLGQYEAFEEALNWLIKLNPGEFVAEIFISHASALHRSLAFALTFNLITPAEATEIAKSTNPNTHQ